MEGNDTELVFDEGEEEEEEEEGSYVSGREGRDILMGVLGETW